MIRRRMKFEGSVISCINEKCMPWSTLENHPVPFQPLPKKSEDPGGTPLEGPAEKRKILTL